MTDIPQTMIAIGIATPGGPEVLKPQTRPVPQPGAGEILVAVAAAGVNRPDVLQRQGGYNPPPGASDIPGLEIAGTVVARGDGAGRFALGDRVCGLVAGGGYAEYAVVHESNALPAPAGLSLTEAGAIPETFFTVWTNVFQRGRLQAGESFLVHGGSSGIGTTAIQLAKAFGATVLATAGSDEKCRACRDLGADHAINYRTDDFVAAAKAATDGKGVDLILDMVGGDYIDRNYETAADQGRIVQIAFLNGPKATVNFSRLMLKRLVHTGSTLRPRTVAEKAAIAAELQARVWPLLEAGRCKPLINATFPLAEAAEAHRLMESSSHIGKIVLTV
ncbi:MAG: NAD(P)H-quinone oxidoreductase [Bosea sp.]|uniref:NAD(P)H-quinone oxidoreductase n=1 Tax=unclassified Bosea (in: a-proteobacteria) TaxID=2653178 RepID=UPI0009651A52|nr:MULTISPECIES: NAD(P)H-quinone oxidoreductase [unclassified Bosea (in: a-proteobacteria)]MBN9458831.1 NAD(P)H-quinone oxidoreductase [Bosea sp. (in: a-proteobacteria)]OJV04408.1 MAG: NAD(P)H-quinone oxidoreductase [Bosea sp. 67-29]